MKGHQMTDQANLVNKDKPQACESKGGTVQKQTPKPSPNKAAPKGKDGIINN